MNQVQTGATSWSLEKLDMSLEFMHGSELVLINSLDNAVLFECFWPGDLVSFRQFITRYLGELVPRVGIVVSNIENACDSKFRFKVCVLWNT